MRQAMAANALSARSGPQPPAPSVVLVDDDAAVLSSLKFALEMEGLRVMAYGSSAELLSAKPSDIGCLVLDYHLPGMDGVELLQNLRRAGVSAPAIVITSAPSKLLRRRLLAEGVAIVEKPLLGSALLDAIRDAVETAAS